MIFLSFIFPILYLVLNLNVLDFSLKIFDNLREFSYLNFEYIIQEIRKEKNFNGIWTIGSCDDPHKTIYIYQGLKKYLLKKVLCHEITHAAMYSYNVNLSLEQEELLADLLSTYGEEIIEIANRVFAKLIGRYA